MTLVAYPADTFDLGLDRQGRAVSLVPMTHEAARVIGEATPHFGPWRHYGIPAAAMTRSYAPPDVPDNGARYQARVDGVLAGAIVVRDPWLVGPYLQSLAVLPNFQSSGIGALMLHWFEARARQVNQRNIWLCVTTANTGAQRFYERHGWELAADIDGLLRDGEGEKLLRKRLVS